MPTRARSRSRPPEAVKHDSASRRGGARTPRATSSSGSEPSRPTLVERPAVWALWRNGAGFFLYDGKSDTYRAVASAEAGLIEMLGSDRRAAALVAFELLAGPDAGLLAAPLAASVAGSLDCGGRRCWSVDFTPATPPVHVRAELDQTTRLVRSVEIRLDAIDALTASDDVAAALLEAKKRRARRRRHAHRRALRAGRGRCCRCRAMDPTDDGHSWRRRRRTLPARSTRSAPRTARTPRTAHRAASSARRSRSGSRR